MRLNHLENPLKNNESSTESRGEILEFQPKTSPKKKEPWIKRGPSPVVWPDDHRYRDGLIITPEGHVNITLSEAYYLGELTKEAEEKVNEQILRVAIDSDMLIN